MRNSAVPVRRFVGLSLTVAVALSAPLAVAKDKTDSASSKKSGSEKKKVLVGGFDGPRSDQARRGVIAALKEDGAYDVSESSGVRPGGDDKSYASASAGAAAVLVGTVKKGTGLVLSVHNGADGALIQDVEIKGESSAKLSKNIDATLAASVADAIGQGKPASGDESPAPDKGDDKAENKDKGDDKADKKPEQASDDAALGPSPLDITVGLRAVHRSFDYHDTPAQLFPNAGYKAPLTYSLPLGPAIFFDATLYPGAFLGSTAASYVGITGGYELGFATKSEFAENTPSQRELTTKSSQFYVGLRGRLPVGEHEFGVIAAYGQQNFTLAGDEASPLVPDVTYKFIRLGADARLRFDDLTIGFHVGTRIVSNTGGLQRDWFPNTKTQALDAGVLLGYAIFKHLDLVGGVDVTRYAFNFNPIPNSANPNTDAIAGGAVDEYVSGWLGVRYLLPGQSRSN